jgi:uncharacterized protein (TIRG00374 family)
VNLVVTESTITEPAGWRRHWSWAKWLVAATFLAILFRHHGPGLSKITRELTWQTVDWLSLLTAVALCGGAILLTFLRWYCLVAAQRLKFTVRDAMRLGFIGYLFNFVGPGSVGGDLVKAELLAKEQPDRRTTAVATVLLDRILGLLALFMIGACAAWWQWDALQQRVELQAIVGLLVVGSTAGLIGLGLMMIPAVTHSRVWTWIGRLPVIGHLIAELVEGVRLYQTQRRVLFLALGISLLGHLGTISSFYFSARAISGTKFFPTYAQHLFFIPAGELAGIVPLSPGGLGLLEGAIDSLYELNGAAVGTGLLTVLAYRAVTIMISLIGAGYYFSSRREIDQALHVEPNGSNDPVAST